MKMLHLTLPEFKEMENIGVRLDKLRMMKFKDGRKVNPSQKTIIPLELKKHRGRKGIYIICEKNQVKYVGATTNFEERMVHHIFLKKNPEIKRVFFLEENDKSKRLIMELLYKYHYFGKAKVEWNYAR